MFYRTTQSDCPWATDHNVFDWTVGHGQCRELGTICLGTFDDVSFEFHSFNLYLEVIVLLSNMLTFINLQNYYLFQTMSNSQESAPNIFLGWPLLCHIEYNWRIKLKIALELWKYLWNSLKLLHQVSVQIVMISFALDIFLVFSVSFHCFSFLH